MRSSSPSRFGRRSGVVATVPPGPSLSEMLGEGIVERGRQKQNTSPVATAPVGRGEGWPAQKAMTNSLKGSGVAQKRAAFTLPRFPDFQFGRTGGGGVNPTGTDQANNTPTIPSFLPSPSLLLVDGPRRALEDDSTGLIA